MKQLYIVILALFIFSCTNKDYVENNNKEQYSVLDSVVSNSKNNIQVVAKQSQKSDSVITNKIIKTVTKIESLNQEVTILKKENHAIKTENNMLKDKLNSINDTGKPYKLLPISNN